MREGRCSGVLPLLGVGLAAWVVPMSALADSVETPYFRATSASDLEILDETRVRVLGPGAGPFDVRFELLDDWFYEDGSASPRDERLVDLTIFRKICRTDEEQAEISLWYPTNPHLRTATIEAKDFPKHHLYLYPSPEKSGVSLSETVPAWTIKERARHKSTGFVPLAVKDLKTDMVSAPAVESGVYPHGEYECTYSTSWSWPECAYGECYAQASATTVNEVHALSLEQGEASDGYRALGEKDWSIAYIGLDRTSHSTPLKVSRKVKAKIVDQFEGATEYEWRVGPDCVSMGANNAEEFEFGVEDVSKATPSKELMDQQLSCKATIFGCHDDCRAEATVVTNFTIVAVDVTIDMADCEKKTDTDKLLGYAWSESEKIEETQGAFIHYEDDHGMEPFSPRGSNALTRVWFSVMPANLPNDDKIHLSFPEKALWEGSQSRGKMVYTPARPEYTVGELKDKIFFLHGHKPSKTICDHEITIEHEKSGAKDRAKYTVVELDLVPDFDRDHKIDKNDEKKVVQQKTFYWWVNDDGDDGDCSSNIVDQGHELQGRGNNHKDSKVNGRTELLDFFPVWTNIAQAKKLCDLAAKNEYGPELTLKLNSSGFGYVQTGELTKEDAGSFLWKDSAVAGDPNKLLHEASVRSDKNEEFQKKYLEVVEKAADKGILMVEGRGKAARMQLELCRDKTPLISVSLKCDVREVGDMICTLNLCGKSGTFAQCKIDDSDFQMGDKTVVYLHGFKVSEDYAAGWNEDAFKRLYQSGSNAKFVGVAWPGIEVGSSEPGLYYHRCAYRAFQKAKEFAELYKKHFADKKTVLMAHSLGNILVSSAIQDYEGVNPNCYFILNGAVPSEAYDESRYNPMGKVEQYLINFRWRKTEGEDSGYPLVSYCSEWHRLYENDKTNSGKSRAELTWKGRFKDVCQRSKKVINYSSPGDEVFEISTDENFSQITGNRPTIHSYDASQFCWQKQEVYKGVSAWDWMKDSDEGGWGFNPKEGCSLRDADVNEEKRAYTKDNMKLIGEDELKNRLKEKPAFNVNPKAVFQGSAIVAKDEQDRLLSCAIPAVSLAMGNATGETVGGITNKDLQTMRQQWGRTDKRYQNRWLHCDLKDMAYFYNRGMWDDLVKEGGLK